MSAVSMRVRMELRSGWRAALSLVLLIGIGGGAAIGAAAGARRTTTAYDRYRTELRAHDATITAPGEGPLRYAGEVNALPEVAAGGLAAAIYLNLLEPKPPPNAIIGQAYASVGGHYGYTIDRPKLLAGRLPDPDVATEVVVNRFFAEQLGLSVGDTMKARQFDIQANGEHGPPFTFRVVGIGVYPNEIVPVTYIDRLPVFYLSPAFYRDVVEKERVPFYLDVVRLRPGVDLERFNDTANRIASSHGDAQPIFFSSEEQRIARIRRAFTPLGVALAAFAGVVLVALLVLVGQLLARQLSIDAAEYPRLRALGMTTGDLVAVGLIKAAVVAVGGAALAVGVAFGVSPLMPIGPARLAEPSPGVEANLAFLVAGFAGLAVLLTGATFIPARRAATRTAGPLGLADLPGAERPSTLARMISRAGVQASGVAGIRMALEPGRGSTALPVRSTLIASAVAFAALTATVTFGASLDRLVSTPAMYGQRWDQLYDAAFEGLPLADVTKNSDLEALSGGFYAPLRIEERRVSAVGIDVLRGDAVPTIVHGRAPADADEIALGAQTLRALSRSIGDTVTVDVEGAAPRRMRIVGRAVFPRFGLGIFLPTGLGDGALLTAGAIRSGGPPGLPEGAYGFALVRYRPGASVRPTEEMLRRRCDEVNATGELCVLETRQVPADVETYAKMRALPAVLTGLLAVIAAAAIGHALVSAVQRRRRDLAILKTLGFVGGQVRAAVAWHASTIAAIALLVGVPVGVAGGRWAWRVFADSLGVVPEPVVPALSLGVAVPASLVIANLIAAGPARLAARMRPAVVLRTD